MSFKIVYADDLELDFNEFGNYLIITKKKLIKKLFSTRKFAVET